MEESLNGILTHSTNMFFYIMVSMGFFFGIILMIAPEAYHQINNALQKEYGLKVRLLPKLEDRNVDFVDRIMIKYRKATGLMISISAFVLLLFNK